MFAASKITHRCFLPGIAGTLCPLTAALSGNPKVLSWKPDMETAFATPKAALWQPLGFFSKKLSKTEVNYSTFDQELLAAVSAIKHFRSRLEGRPFQLWTDHKPLIFALNWVSPLTSG